MTIASGKFIWYDQMSNDLPGSEKFYSEVVGWNLATNTMNDQAYTLLAVGNSAFAFYSGLFSWTKSDAIDMGPMGTYQIFNIDDVQAGGMMTKTPQTPRPFWLYYINVEAIDAAAARATKAGGKICNGPLEVPGGQWIVQCLDPQGAMFAMVAPQR